MKKFKFSDFKIIIDSREQRPWLFDKLENPCEIGTLKTGDYSLESYENSIVVERKSAADFITSVTRDRKRFKAELERARDIKHFAVIVEERWDTINAGIYRSRAAPSSIIGSAMGIMAEFGVPVIMAESRKNAEMLCEKFLRLCLIREYKEKEE